MTRNKILAIIPARGGSKGLPRKNILKLMNTPLIGWSINEAKASKYIDKLIVTTDDNEIAEISKSLKVEVIMRPYELAQDHSSVNDAILHALEYLENSKNYRPEYVLLLQCTTPLRKVEHIDQAIEKLLENKDGAESLVSVCLNEHSPFWSKKINDMGLLEDLFTYDKTKYSRRQDFAVSYRLNGAIYLCNTEAYRRNGSFDTGKVLPYIMDSIYSTDIDTEQDFIYVEFLLGKYPELK